MNNSLKETLDFMESVKKKVDLWPDWMKGPIGVKAYINNLEEEHKWKTKKEN